MDHPTEKDPSLEDSDELDAQEFNKNEFSIEIEETKEGKQTFFVKSEEFFQKIVKSLKNFADYFKFKFKKIFSRKDTEEQHYVMSKKIYKQHKRLEKKMKELEVSLEKTTELTGQIKEDTSKIVLEVEWVVILLERQMARIEDVETYMRTNLGSDWSQLKQKWQEFKQGDISRGEFVKIGLRKLGKKFLGIFVSTS